jgi:hypothetical protein
MISDRDLQVHAHAMWKRGFDTWEIAQRLKVEEYRVYNALAHAKGQVEVKLKVVGK